MQNYKSVKVLFYSVALLSTITLMLNSVFHHVVRCRSVELGGTVYRMFTNLEPWYEVHRCFSYFLALCSVMVLLVQIVKTPAFYRGKYYPALLVLIFTLGMEGICSAFDLPLDFALYFYIVLAMFLIYYSMYRVPKTLITKILAMAMENANSGIVCFNNDDKCIYANDRALNMYGNPLKLSAFEKIFKAQTKVEKFQDNTKNVWDLELTEGDKPIYYQVSFGELRDEKGYYLGCYFYLYDKTQDMEDLAKERYRATHDTLTGVYNMEYFYEKSAKLISEHPDVQYYIVCTDIKDFKLINNRRGFEKGNEVLVAIAQSIQKSLPDNAACGRFSGDRFAVCIPKENFHEESIIKDAQAVATIIDNTDYQLHIHIGVYCVQEGDDDVAVMCDRARMAIQTIKKRYEEYVAYYDEGLMDKVMREKRLLGEFDKALEQGQFVMFLQPQVKSDGTVIGAEALVRWQHPEHGMVSPGEFIPLLERSGLIHRLDMYIWEQAAAKLKEWREEGRENLHISVNISTKDFHYVDIYKTFTELVEKYDIPVKNLKLEITESALMLDKKKQLPLLESLQKYGFDVEIDDFGSGYSSLNMLKDMRADVLKLDMGFLQETQQEERTRIILNMVVDLAKQLQMIVVSEGVENKDQVDYLTSVGCDIFQGFYFERPISVADFEERYF